MSGIVVSNIVMSGVTVPVFVRLGNRARKHAAEAREPGVSVLENVSISNVIARDTKAVGCSITGIPGHNVRNVYLQNIRVHGAGGVTGSVSDTVDEHEKSYPEATMFGNLPACGFFVRHADNVRIRDYSLTLTEPDTRPAVLARDVHGLRIEGMQCCGRTAELQSVDAKDCTDVVVRE